MYRVVIADDEVLIRRGLIETVDWEALGYEIAGEASNGEKALELIQQLSPKLLITDIKMPIMNGIQLIERIRAQKHNVRIIVLSGYNDFEYLKKAIYYNVDNYLLKPLKQKELIEVLKLTASNIENDYLSKKQLFYGRQLLKNNTLKRLIHNNISIYEFKEKQKMCGIKIPDNNIGVFLGCSEEKLNQIDMFSVINICHEILNEGEVFSDNANEVIILGTMESVRLKIDQLINCLHHFLGIDMIFHGKLSEQIEDINLTYKSLVNEQILATPKMIEDPSSNGLVEEVLKYCKSYYFENLSLKAIAQYFDVNASYLGLLIKNTKGISFTEFINGYRVDKAIEYLKTTNLKIYEIAEEVGYTNYQYFLKMFKKHTGKTPSDYRI